MLRETRPRTMLRQCREIEETLHQHIGTYQATSQKSSLLRRMMVTGVPSSVSVCISLPISWLGSSDTESPPFHVSAAEAADRRLVAVAARMLPTMMRMLMMLRLRTTLIISECPIAAYPLRVCTAMPAAETAVVALRRGLILPRLMCLLLCLGRRGALTVSKGVITLHPFLVGRALPIDRTAVVYLR